MTVPIVYVDTETTDLGPRRLAWDLAMIRREPDGTRREFQAFIEVDLSDANPFALSIGRFYERHPLGQWLAAGTGVHPGSALTEVPFPKRWRLGVEDATGGYLDQREAALLWCRWTHGAHVIGAVPNFDTEVMGWAARTAGLIGSHHYHLACVEVLQVGYLLGLAASAPELSAAERQRIRALCVPPWKSDELMAELGVTIPDDERHTALGDARGVERAFLKIMGDAL